MLSTVNTHRTCWFCLRKGCDKRREARMGYFLRQGEGGALKKRSPNVSCAKQPCGEKAGQSGREGPGRVGRRCKFGKTLISGRDRKTQGDLSFIGCCLSCFCLGRASSAPASASHAPSVRRVPEGEVASLGSCSCPGL